MRWHCALPAFCITHFSALALRTASTLFLAFFVQRTCAIPACCIGHRATVVLCWHIALPAFWIEHCLLLASYTASMLYQTSDDMAYAGIALSRLPACCIWHPLMLALRTASMLHWALAMLGLHTCQHLNM
jgi:hypothetical protein